jgi:amino acid transporter
VAEEASVANEAQPATQPVAPEAQSQRVPPYGLYVITLALILVSLVAFSAMLIFRNLFETATDVTTVLSSMFAVVGTLVGAYFGVKASNDATDKVQHTLDRTSEVTNRALAELDPEVGRRVIKDTSRTAP